MPIFEHFARSVLKELLDSPWTSASGWMSAWHLLQTWQAAGRNTPVFTVELVPVDHLKPRIVIDAIATVSGVSKPLHMCDPRHELENVKMPDLAVELWQSHLHRFTTSAPAARGRTFQAMMSGAFGFPTQSLNHIAMDAESARLIDAAFPSDGSKGADETLEILASRLHSRKPVTMQLSSEEQAHFVDESRSILEAMAAYQRRMDRLYRASRPYRGIRDFMWRS